MVYFSFCKLNSVKNVTLFINVRNIGMSAFISKPATLSKKLEDFSLRGVSAKKNVILSSC